MVILPYSLKLTIFCFPAYTHNKEVAEPWGLVINEALSASRPVIVTDAVGCSEDLVINGYNGYVVKEKDIDGLKNAKRDILINNEKLFHFKSNAYNVIEAVSYTHLTLPTIYSV